MRQWVSKIIESLLSQKDSEEPYVPMNLDDALEHLLKIVPKKELESYQNYTDGGDSLHHSFGRRLRNDWKLWCPESRLTQWFNSQGIHHADDMSGIILRSLWLRLNDRPINFEKQVQKAKTYWESMKALQESGRTTYTVTFKKNEDGTMESIIT